MKCPLCNKSTVIIATRKSEDKIRRRKECRSCLVRFTTYEIMDQDYEDIIKQKHRVLEQAEAYAKWTKEEDEMLVKLKNIGLPRADIALEMGRTKGSIKKRMQVMGARL